jgi:conjugal transfer pilus assembly protein TraW
VSAAIASPLTEQDEELIARSRALMLQADGNGPELPAAESVLPDLPAAAFPQNPGQNIHARQNTESQGAQWLLFASLSLGEAALKALLRDAAATDTTVVFRGIPEGRTLGQGIRHLHQLLAGIEPPPSVTIDPVAFRRWGVTTVPQLIKVKNDALITRAAGITSRDWLRRRSETGAVGDLGTWGPVVSPSEPDLLETLQARLGQLDLATLKQEAISQFWSRQRFPDLPPARQDRTQWLDPTVELQTALRDAEGRVLVPAGTRINPLAKLPFRQALVVFDARNPLQLQRVQDWLAPQSEIFASSAMAPVQNASEDAYKNAYQRITLVTTGISPAAGWDDWAALEQQFARPVYLLNTALQARFQLREVPAVIDAVGERFRVRYLAVPESVQVQQ